MLNYAKLCENFRRKKKKKKKNNSSWRKKKVGRSIFASWTKKKIGERGDENFDRSIELCERKFCFFSFFDSTI